MNKNMNSRQSRFARKQLGATLIEILVSLFVFSVGALGIAALQTTSLVRSDDTKQRSVALWKAQELVDKIRSTKTLRNPDGMVAQYLAEISNDEAGIGEFDSGDEFSCPNSAPTRCDTANANCGSAEVVAFDVWSVMCDADTGLVSSNAADGSVGLRNLEISLVQDGGEYRLYFEWLSRSSNNNIDDGSDGDGVDTGIQAATGAARTVTTNLCGDDVEVDSRLDAYCVRFE